MGSQARTLRVWRVTKYNPADRDERGRYVGCEDTDSDYGPVEAAYLDTVAAFAEETGVDVLQIREPSVPVVTGVGWDFRERFGGLVELFGVDMDGYYDGAAVQLDHAVNLVRLMLRGGGEWCRLEAGDAFFVHVGWDQYVYVGSSAACPRAVAFAHKHGLFAEPVSGSPYVFGLDDDDHIDVRPADAAFWADLAGLVDEFGGALLEEGYVHNDSRWHRLIPSNVDTVRDRLTPRARLLVWPDLSADVPAVLDSLSGEGLVEVVWQDHAGRITGRLIEESDQPAVRARLADAAAATALPVYAEQRRPFMTAVLPDADGVLRARWTP
ncbi:hypothetical protein Nm8I071_39070 [Nonomuraea sp. TT08I-71]|nr:hypothetical protein Nm8I071_39070 [Nonomuraea sp. TT08I-71]